MYAYTDANFFKSSKRRADGSVILIGDCKACRSEYTKDYERQRYQNDAAYQQKCKDRAKAYWDGLSSAAKLAHRKKRLKRERERAMQRGED